MTRLVQFFQRLFAPKGSLLGPDILAEVTIHVFDAQHKAIISKIEDTPNLALRQRTIQALLFTAIDMARERRIDIQWERLAQVYPPNVAPK